MARILAIDDDEGFLSAVEAMLIQAGHAVTTAVNGAKAAKLFRVEPFELIVTDIMMPDKDGLETIMELHRDFPEVPVIAVSGGSKFSSQYLDIAKRLGARSTLPKPFTSEQLANAIAQALA